MEKKEVEEEETRDTIPASLKEHFFENKTAPCILKDYDVVGFSVDHCLVKYNVLDTVRLAVEVILADLQANFKGYPK